MFSFKETSGVFILVLSFILLSGCGRGDYDYTYAANAQGIKSVSGQMVYKGEFADGPVYGVLTLTVSPLSSNFYNTETSSFTAIGNLKLNNDTYTCRTSMSGSLKWNTGYGFDGFESDDVGGIQSLSLLCNAYGTSNTYYGGTSAYNTITVTIPQRCDPSGSYPYVYLTGNQRLEGCFSIRSNIQNPIPSYYNIDKQVFFME